MLSRALLNAVNNDFLAADPLTDPNKLYYSPGVIGFLAVFVMMVAATFLILDMVRRVRRVRYRQEIQEKLASEAAAKGRKANK
ncbi:MAG: hypothetical protein RLZ53_1049 [Actinomycetota bacterium]|jgi:hypothetical protein